LCGSHDIYFGVYFVSMTLSGVRLCKNEVCFLATARGQVFLSWMKNDDSKIRQVYCLQGAEYIYTKKNGWNVQRTCQGRDLTKIRSSYSVRGRHDICRPHRIYTEVERGL
jgi:hypothetical protein